MILVSTTNSEMIDRVRSLSDFNFTWFKGDTFIGCEDKPALDSSEGLLFRWGDITRVEENFEKDFKSRGSQLFWDMFSKGDRSFPKHFNGRYQLMFLDKDSAGFSIYNSRYQSGAFSYFHDDSLFLLGDNVDQLIRLLRAFGKLNVHFPSVHNFLANGFNVSDETLVQGIRKIFPACWLHWDGRSVKLDSRWQEEFNFQRTEFGDLEAHLDHYESVYREGLRDYLEERRPKELGTLLSGGHDTSFVMAQSSQVFSKPVHAFTVVFPEWEFNEGPYAERICNKFGGKYHPIDFRKEHMDLSVSLIRANHEPVVGSSLPLHLLAKEASQITDTMLGGDAGDTMWGEYYPVAEYHRLIKHLPLGLRRGIHSLSKIARDLTDWERFWELEHVSQLFTDADPYPDFMRRLCTYRHFGDDIQRQLFGESFEKNGFSRGSLVIPFTRENFTDALIEGKLYNAFLTYQAFHTTNCMRHFGVDFFMPTLEKKVVRFINNLPYHWVNGGNFIQRLSNSKTINRKFHKRALARYLDSSEIYNRSFDIPWFMLLRPRKALLDGLLKRLIKRGWFNESFLKQMFSEFSSQQHKTHELLELKNHGYRIFTLLSLEIWCTEYIDGRMTSPSEALSIDLDEYLNVY